MDKKNSMDVQILDENAEDKIKDILKEAPVELIKDLLKNFYSYKAQQSINDREYTELGKLEGLMDLYEVLDHREF